MTRVASRLAKKLELSEEAKEALEYADVQEKIPGIGFFLWFSHTDKCSVKLNPITKKATYRVFDIHQSLYRQVSKSKFEKYLIDASEI